MRARGAAISFVRVGTLYEPDRLPPDIPHLHGIQTSLASVAARHASRAGVLRPQAVLAARQPGAAPGPAGPGQPAKGLRLS